MFELFWYFASSKGCLITFLYISPCVIINSLCYVDSVSGSWVMGNQHSVVIFLYVPIQFSSVQFSRSVVSDSLRPHESQHARPPWSSPSPGVHSNSRPLNQWCHPAISSSVVPFSSCPQTLPAAESFPMSQLFSWGGQSTGDWPSGHLFPSGSSGKESTCQCRRR